MLNLTEKNIRQEGFTMIDLVIGLIIIGLLATVFISFLVGRSNSMETAANSKAATDAAENAMKKLSAASSLPVGGSFTVTNYPDTGEINYGLINKTGCLPSTCDFIIEPGDALTADSTAGGISWQKGFELPEGARILFVRRWLIEEINPELRLKKITVAVLSDEDSDKPLYTLDTIVGDK